MKRVEVKELSAQVPLSSMEIAYLSLNRYLWIASWELNPKGVGGVGSR